MDTYAERPLPARWAVTLTHHGYGTSTTLVAPHTFSAAIRAYDARTLTDGQTKRLIRLRPDGGTVLILTHTQAPPPEFHLTYEETP